MHVFDTAILLYKIMHIQANNRLNGVGGKARYIYMCIEPDQRYIKIRIMSQRLMATALIRSTVVKVSIHVARQVQ